MMQPEQRAIYEAYLALCDNRCWQIFCAELGRKEAYMLSRLAEAASWEESCRLQGALALVRQLLALAENMGKGEIA